MFASIPTCKQRMVVKMKSVPVPSSGRKPGAAPAARSTRRLNSKIFLQQSIYIFLYMLLYFCIPIYLTLSNSFCIPISVGWITDRRFFGNLTFNTGFYLVCSFCIPILPSNYLARRYLHHINWLIYLSADFLNATHLFNPSSVTTAK